MARMKSYKMQTYLDLMMSLDLLVESNLYDVGENEVKGLTYDSREVAEDTLFICKGAAFKTEYLSSAVKSGAIGYISEQKMDQMPDVAYIIVKDIRLAMAPLADKFYNSAWKELKVIGIGGTKGKSTTAYYVKAIIDDYMAAAGKPKCAILSSIDIYDGVTTLESHITTPEAVELHQHFRNALDSGMEYLVMEVSSQALKYHRVDQIRFAAGVFLNISEDHISPIEHEDFADYFHSKMQMFEQCDVAAVNLDADFSDRILEAAQHAENTVTFSQKEKADYFGYDIMKCESETNFKVRTETFDEDFQLTMPGLFNVENALGAIAAASILHIPVEYIRSGLRRAKSSGRMELYESKDKEIIAIVDYAHNKLSFEKLFSSMREEYPQYAIVSLFGCPGKKAYLRRKDLGTIAGTYSKKVYLAAEDPGFEPVAEISQDIAQYVAQENCPYVMIEDRGEAIRTAIEEAEGKTLILVTGKGNETRQKYGSEYIDCLSDVEYVKMYLAEYDARCTNPACYS